MNAIYTIKKKKVLMIKETTTATPPPREGRKEGKEGGGGGGGGKRGIRALLIHSRTTAVSGTTAKRVGSACSKAG